MFGRAAITLGIGPHSIIQVVFSSISGILEYTTSTRNRSSETNANYVCYGRLIARQSSSGRQPNFAALNRARLLCSAGRPSRWALAHISSSFYLSFFSFSSPNLSRSVNAYLSSLEMTGS